ncbi:hypothetical protein [Burkholderia gladioli]|uniref:hypothetical protein n=1 Tax=Burkholderia gladioli TaxID=28095 RepID=UPI000BBD0855|nr:hypothetical protein [Burkholderia gladioli]ATF84546.1 hypothetical protein CO712_05425 [Burkholderia gladioli pv. gladioli]
MNPWMKFLAAVLLFGAWLALVLMHYVQAQPFVDAIGYTLVGLGIYHASTGATAIPMISALVGGARAAAPATVSVNPSPPSDPAPSTGPSVQQAAPTPTIQ